MLNKGFPRCLQGGVCARRPCLAKGMRHPSSSRILKGNVPFILSTISEARIGKRLTSTLVFRSWGFNLGARARVVFSGDCPGRGFLSLATKKKVARAPFKGKRKGTGGQPPLLKIKVVLSKVVFSGILKGPQGVLVQDSCFFQLLKLLLPVHGSGTKTQTNGNPFTQHSQQQEARLAHSVRS